MAEQQTELALRGEGIDACVYVICYKEIPGLYKIGSTHNFQSRMKLLEWSSPFKAVVVREIKVATGQKLEHELHRRFADKRVKLEWFQLDDQDIAYIMTIKDEEYGVEEELEAFDKELRRNKHAARVLLVKWVIARDIPFMFPDEEQQKKLRHVCAPYLIMSREEAIEEFIDAYVFSSMWLGDTTKVGVGEIIKTLRPLFKSQWFEVVGHIDNCIQKTASRVRKEMQPDDSDDYTSAGEELGYA